jgi:hypothetical protein
MRAIGAASSSRDSAFALANIKFWRLK